MRVDRGWNGRLEMGLQMKRNADVDIEDCCSGDVQSR